MISDLFGKWKKNKSTAGYEDDEQKSVGKATLERLDSILASREVNKKESPVELNLEKATSGLLGSTGGSSKGRHSESAFDSQTKDPSSGMIELSSAKIEKTLDPVRSEMTTIKHPAEPHQIQSIPSEDRTSSSSSTKLKASPVILVVEDEPVTQRLIKKILEEQHGYGVVTAGDGIEALMELGKREFDLILSDLSMPNLDGFKLLDFINMKNIRTPIIFLTGSDDVEDEIKVLALGAKDYVRKPINRDLLLLRISKLLNRQALPLE